MSFVEAFYSFNLDISLTSRGMYAVTRIKIPKHPEELLEELIGRVFAYCYSYEEGMVINPGRFDTKIPSLMKKNIIGEITHAIEVGSVAPELVKRNLKKRPPPRYEIFFYAKDHLERFCNGLKGSTENWIAPISFYWLDEVVLEAIAQETSSSSTWSFLEADGIIYLTVNGKLHQTSLAIVAMWEEFQKFLMYKNNSSTQD